MGITKRPFLNSPLLQPVLLACVCLNSNSKPSPSMRKNYDKIIIIFFNLKDINTQHDKEERHTRPAQT